MLFIKPTILFIYDFLHFFLCNKTLLSVKNGEFLEADRSKACMLSASSKLLSFMEFLLLSCIPNLSGESCSLFHQSYIQPLPHHIHHNFSKLIGLESSWHYIQGTCTCFTVLHIGGNISSTRPHWKKQRNFPGSCISLVSIWFCSNSVCLSAQ